MTEEIAFPAFVIIDWRSALWMSYNCILCSVQRLLCNGVFDAAKNIAQPDCIVRVALAWQSENYLSPVFITLRAR